MSIIFIQKELQINYELSWQENMNDLLHGKDAFSIALSMHAYSTQVPLV